MRRNVRISASLAIELGVLLGSVGCAGSSLREIRIPPSTSADAATRRDSGDPRRFARDAVPDSVMLRGEVGGSYNDSPVPR
jgi:hypothetical protein